MLVHEVVFGAATTEQQQITNAHTLPEQAAQVFSATKPKLAIYSHLILFGASDDDVMAATRKVYSGRVEMGTDLTVIEVGDSVTSGVPSDFRSGSNALPRLCPATAFGRLDRYQSGHQTSRARAEPRSSV